MTRAEHLKWCKERALEYARRGEAQNAVASMASDLRKHDDTAPSAEMASQLGTMLLMSGNLRTLKQIVDWVEGFN